MIRIRNRMFGINGFVGILLIVTTLSCSRTHDTPCDRFATTEFGNSTTAKPLFPYRAMSINWEFIEDSSTSAQRLQFMDTVYWYRSMYGKSGNPGFTHVLDLNADGAADYVYSGPGPGFDTRELINVFKINNTSFSILGTLKSMDFEHGILKRVYVECAADTNATKVTQQNSYSIEYDQGKPTLRKFFQSEMSDTTELPPSLLDNYHLKTFCDDSIIFRAKPRTLNGPPGRQLAAAKGFVLAEKVDADNHKWLFMAVAAGGDSTYQVGWTPDEAH